MTKRVRKSIKNPKKHAIWSKIPEMDMDMIP